MHLFGRQVVIYTSGSSADRPVCIKPPEKDFCNVSPTICSDLWTFILVNNAADALKCQVLNSLEHYGDGIRVEEETASITLLFVWLLLLCHFRINVKRRVSVNAVLRSIFSLADKTLTAAVWSVRLGRGTTTTRLGSLCHNDGSARTLGPPAWSDPLTSRPAVLDPR